MYKIRVFDRVFCPDPHRPFGDFENPLGQLAVASDLRSGPRARRAALGDFQNPLRAPGIWAKIPSQKPEFSIYILPNYPPPPHFSRVMATFFVNFVTGTMS